MQNFLELQCLVYYLVDYFRTIKVYSKMKNILLDTIYIVFFKKNSYELCKLMTCYYTTRE